MSEFSNFLYEKYVEKNKKHKMSIRSLASTIGISHNYLGQILHGKVNAPEADIQKKIANELITIDERNKFFDLAAKDRKEIPIDIMEKASEQDKTWNEIRVVLGDKEIRK